nr:SDR family NAD(P)-dependent oxidoreductase [Micromonospora sp. DSM 115978]
EQTDAATWARLFATNVTGASVVTAAALPHLARAGGAAVYLSSVSASNGPPWPFIGAYAASKAALDKLVEAWRVEHPSVGFTRLTVADCLGGEGHSGTGFADEADPEIFKRAVTDWSDRGYLSGNFVDVDHLVELTNSVLRFGNSSVIPSVSLVARVPAGPSPTAGLRN